jgi:hypothetical protein
VLRAHWLIQGYDGLIKIYERRVEAGLTSRQVEALLKALAAKCGLTFDEVVGAYATRRTRIANDLLDITWDVRTRRFGCGTDPHFTARLVRSSPNEQTPLREV